MWRTWHLESNALPFASGSWAAPAFAGAGLILSALMIFIMPQLVAYLVGTLLLWGGVMVIAMAWHTRRAEKAAGQEQFRSWQIW